MDRSNAGLRPQWSDHQQQVLIAVGAGFQVHEVWVLRGVAMKPFDAADYSSGEADHIYTAIEKDYRDLSALLPQLLDRQLIPVLI